ncbi:hypothetical protein SAMN05216503_1968 [Polaribacter sp. KT25b]|uniref:hypothetical protein n=1 Tax=Polaribacter sp. KT25b TaxID=1855336 RepID=UPI00087B41A6|nr:hypothetical protein [Polaribacter sp. KT25b]SDS09668.1 hypothetical protein SAMN05216503_1968 [Polaribacter sp. KT25b]
MIKKTILTTALLLMVFGLHAQVKDTQGTTTYELDLSKPAIINTKGLKIKTKKQLVFKLTNANPFKYRYVIKHEFVNIFKDESFVNIEELLKKQETTGEQNDDKNKVVKLVEIQKNIKTIISSYNAEELTNAKTVLSFASSDALTTKDSLKIAIELVENSQKILLSTVDNYLQSLKDLPTINQDEFIEQRTSFKEKYNKNLTQQQLLKISFEFFTKDDDLKTFITTYQQSIKKYNDDLVTAINKMFAANFTSYTLPIDVHGKNIDYVNITLERYTLESNSEPEVFNYRFWVTGGVKIDVSAGMFITSLFDAEFSTIDSTTDPGKKTIMENDNGAYDFGFGTMINLKYRRYGNIAPMLSFGILLTANQKFQILAGPGIAIGKDERIIINAGIAMGRVSRLSNTLSLDTPIELGTNEIPTNQKFEIGHFIGITYNLAKPKNNK